MKKANLKKVLFILMVGIVMLFALSVEEQADSAMMDHLNVANNNGIMLLDVASSEAGIYQTAVNAGMKTERTIDSEIANNRSYFGKGETLKVQFSFSKTIKKINSVELGIKFGENGTERVLKNAEQKGSYLVFSYDIVADDNGGLIITYVKGTVTDNDDNEIDIPGINNSNTWQNTIIAKGSWGNSNCAEDSIIFPENEPAYVLDNGEIRKMKLNDVKKYNIKTGEITEYHTTNDITNIFEFDDSGKGVKKIKMELNDEILYVENACDIAGNTFESESDPNNHVSNAHYKHAVYVMDDLCTGTEKDGVRYFKEGDKIVFSALNFCTGMYPNPYNDLGVYFKIGETSMNAQGFNREVIANGLYKITYTIQKGDNGEIEAVCAGLKENGAYDEKRRFDSSKYIADTIAPVINWNYMDLIWSNENSNSPEIKEKRGWIPKDWKKGNDDTQTIPKGNYSEYTDSLAKDTDQNAILYLKEGEPLFNFNVTDDNINIDDSSECIRTTTTISGGTSNRWQKRSDGSSLDAIGNGIASYMSGPMVSTVTATDYAGNNTVSQTSWDAGLKIIVDKKAPEVKITVAEKTNAPDGKIKFTITSTDPRLNYDNKEYYGSGVSGSLDTSKIVVQNGTIMDITQTYSENNYGGDTAVDYGKDITTVTVMPGVDGYVSLYVKEGAVQDHCDNESKASDVGKVLVDRTAPVIHDVTGVPTDWTDEATLSVIASDVSGGIQYKFNDGEWQDTNQIKITQNGEVRIKVKDSLGNESEEKIVKITKIDNVAPTIYGIDYHQGWTNQDVTVTINAKDDESGIKEYSFDGGATWQASPSKTYTSTATIESNKIMVKDKVGNVTTYGNKVEIKIDKVAPSIDEVTVTPEGATEGTVQIAVSAHDSDSMGIQYSFNGSEYTSANNCTVTKNGDVTIQVKDAAGNVTSIVKTINNIVETKPKVTLSNNGGKFVMPTEGKAKIKSTITVDSKSICTVYYGVSTTTTPPESYQTTQGNKVDVALEVSSEGTYYVWAYAVNASGSTAEPVSSEFVVSKSEITLTPNTTEETMNPVVVSVQYGEGLTENRVAGLGDERTANATQVTVTENGIVYAEATDIAGNKVYKTLEINNIKKNEEVTFEQGPDKYIKEVKVIGDKGYLIVNPKTTAEQLKTNVVTNYEKTVENTVEQGQLKTGSTLKIGTVNSEYIIVVKGDANCDGKVEFSDIVKINSIRLEKLAIANVPYEVQLASDVDGNGKIEFSDIVKINSYRLGKTNTL